MLKGRALVRLAREDKMTYPNGKRPTIWGSNASGPVGWIVGIVSVLMLIVGLYLYA